MTGTVNELANPDGLYLLHERPIPGGHVTIDGFARLGDVRVDVQGTAHGRVKVFGELPLPGVHRRTVDPHPGMWGAWGEVDFAQLDRFWLTRTSTFDRIDMNTPLPGMLTTFDDQDVGVADTCGTVSLDGTPQLQVIWRGNGEPAGETWVPDHDGGFTRLIDRDEDAMVRSVEWTAIWRDITVTIADIRGDQALIFVDRRPPPAFSDLTFLERNRQSGWSAVVPYADLALRTWTSRERPLGLGIVAGYVGRVRGRTCVLRPAAGSWTRPSPGIVARKLRYETVTGDFALYGRRAGGPNWLWRADVDERELTEIRHVTTTTVVRGNVRTVIGYLNESRQIFLDDDTVVDRSETSPFRYHAQPLDEWDDIGEVWIPHLPPLS